MMRTSETQHIFRELDVVRIRGTIGVDGVVLPSGSRGTIVLVHRGGVAFEVEFPDPVGTLVTLEPSDLEPA